MTHYQSIVILTGAGISAESTIPTFRSSDGLWENHSIEDVATPAAFAKDPQLVQQFYNQRRAFLSSGITPNAAHYALAKLSKNFSGNFTLITQNIDNLHQRAGTKQVYPMHGELLKMRCAHTGQYFDCNGDILPEHKCPCCQQPGYLRPHVVWFGEMPLYMDTIESALTQCDLFIAIGTSATVYPAAGFSQLAKASGARTIEVNIESTDHSDYFDQQIVGTATTKIPELVDQLLAASPATV